MNMDRASFSLNNLTTNPSFDFLKLLRENQDEIDPNESNDSPYENSNFDCTYVDPLNFKEKFGVQKNISMLTLNVQSLPAKFSELHELISVLGPCAPDVLCLQELWKFPENSNFSLPGYSPLVYRLRGGGAQGGGGLACISKNTLTSNFFPTTQFSMIGYLNLYL